MILLILLLKCFLCKKYILNFNLFKSKFVKKILNMEEAIKKNDNLNEDELKALKPSGEFQIYVQLLKIFEIYFYLIVQYT